MPTVTEIAEVVTYHERKFEKFILTFRKTYSC